jgi:hypothetical protein
MCSIGQTVDIWSMTTMKEPSTKGWTACVCIEIEKRERANAYTSAFPSTKAIDM